MVGAERFELPTYCSQSNRATRLRYAPFPTAGNFQDLKTSGVSESAGISGIRTGKATPFFNQVYRASSAGSGYIDRALGGAAGNGVVEFNGVRFGLGKNDFKPVGEEIFRNTVGPHGKNTAGVQMFRQFV